MQSEAEAGPQEAYQWTTPTKMVYNGRIFIRKFILQPEEQPEGSIPEVNSQIEENSNHTMFGKNTIFTLAFLTILSYTESNTKYKQAEVRGGLLFEKDVEKPVIVNPNYVSYKRKLVLADILKAVDLTQQFTNEYKRFCTAVKETQNNEIMVRTYSYKHKFTHIKEYKKLLDASAECQWNKWKLPKIQTHTDLKDLMLYAKENNITNVNVNMHWDQSKGRVVYSDTGEAITNVLQKMIIKAPDDKTGEIVVDKYDPLAVEAWSKGSYSYLSLVNDTFFIRNMYNADLKAKTMTQIICVKDERPMEVKNNNYLIEIAAHLCDRDHKLLRGMTNVIAREASLFESKVVEDPTVRNLPQVKDCASLEKFDRTRVNLLKTEIEKAGQVIATKVGFAREIGQKWVVFKALGLATLTEFKNFLRSDISRLYLHQNPTEQLLNTVSCIIDHEQGFEPRARADLDYVKLSLFNLEDELDKVHRLVNSATLEYERTHGRQKRQLTHSIGVEEIPSTAPIFNPWNVGYTMGIATVKDIENTWKYVSMNAKALGDIAVNQLEISRGYNDLKDEIKTLQNATTQTDNAVVSITTVLDNKQAILQLHNIVRQSLLIISTAVNSATSGKVSPYVLSENELDSMAKELRNNNVFLTNNLDDIETQVYKLDNEFCFLFSIPIIDNKYLFKIFHIRNFPIFDDREGTHTVVKDMDYLGISIDATQYLEMTDTEYFECIGQTFCKITGIKEPISEESKCVAQSYRKKKQLCQTAHVNTTTPFFASYANLTIYSTPNNFKGELVCPKLNARDDGEPTTGSISFSGVGSMHLQKNCYVELQDNRIIQAQFHAYKTFDLGIATVNEAFQFIPSVENYSFTAKQRDIFENNHIPDLILTNISTFEPVYITQKAVEFDELMPHLIRFGLILLVAAIIFAALYGLVPPFRNWVKACCFINNPKKYWDKKGYQLPNFEKIDRKALGTLEVPGHPNNPTNKLLGDTPDAVNSGDIINRQNDEINNDANSCSDIYAVPNISHKANSLVYSSEPIIKNKPLSKARMDKIMRHEMEDYTARVFNKQRRELERQRQVLLKRTECENAYQVLRDDQGRIIPQREAPQPPSALFTEQSYSNAHPINSMPFNNDIPPPLTSPVIRQRAEELGKLLRFRQQPQ